MRRLQRAGIDQIKERPRILVALANRSMQRATGHSYDLASLDRLMQRLHPSRRDLAPANAVDHDACRPAPQNRLQHG